MPDDTPRISLASAYWVADALPPDRIAVAPDAWVSPGQLAAVMGARAVQAYTPVPPVRHWPPATTRAVHPLPPRRVRRAMFEIKKLERYGIGGWSWLLVPKGTSSKDAAPSGDPFRTNGGGVGLFRVHANGAPAELLEPLDRFTPPGEAQAAKRYIAQYFTGARG